VEVQVILNTICALVKYVLHHSTAHVCISNCFLLPLVSISERYMVCYKAPRSGRLSDLGWGSLFHGNHVLIFIWLKQGTAW